MVATRWAFEAALRSRGKIASNRTFAPVFSRTMPMIFSMAAAIDSGELRFELLVPISSTTTLG
jgi:hypothetical protein